MELKKINAVFIALSVTLVIMGLVQCFEFDEKELETKEGLWNLYERWSKHYKVSRNHSEKQTHFSVFKDKAKYVNEFNKKDGYAYKLELNRFGDMTDDEVRSVIYCSHQSYESLEAQGCEETTGGNDDGGFMHHNDQFKDIPDSIDWREKGAVTEVKDQVQCGSCWAFAVVGSVEGINKIVTGELLDLSEQQLVDCEKESWACCGGFVDAAFNYTKTYGLTTRENYPQETTNMICPNSTHQDRTCYSKNVLPPLVTIDGYESAGKCNEAAMKEFVANQPILVGIDSSTYDFQYYKGGILNGTCGTHRNHAVIIVGYGTDTESGLDYWIVKNSWGVHWGEQGYIRIQRNVDAKAGLCAIAGAPSRPIISGISSARPSFSLQDVM